MDPAEELNYVQLLLPLIAVMSIIAVGVILLHQQFRKSLYKQQLAKEMLKNRHHREILNTSIKVQEDERKRIAGDLHDELGATLSISRMQLLRLEKLAKSHPEQMLGELSKVREYVEQALVSTRRISHELMPAQLQTVGLVQAIEGVANSAQSANDLDIVIESHEDLSHLSWEIKLAIYRIFCELIHNTLKHAEASEVYFRMENQPEEVHFHYHDNGKGLPNEMEAAGIGLRSIEGRVKALNGRVAFGNQEQGGFFAEGSLRNGNVETETLIS